VRLLVTRPEPEGGRTAALLRQRGHQVEWLPLLRIEPIANAELGVGPWAAVLFTSANAVRAIATHRRFDELAHLPVCTVGRRTKAAAAAAGFVSVVSADGDVNALVRLVAARLAIPAGKLIPHSQRRGSLTPQAGQSDLLYCAGEDRAGDLAAALQSHGLRVEVVIVYRATGVTELTPDVRAALASGAIDAVLHYSARTAGAFVAAATRAGIEDLSIQARHLCLSAQVAAPLAAAGATAVEVASEPNEQALLALLGPT
jgi:uroporphyrinogen-III synthase